MKTSSLPRQINFLAFIAFVTVQVILWTSLYSVREAMNTEASEESERLMHGRLQTLQKQVSLIASDYHNWTDIFRYAQALDYESLASNYGITAERGDIFQYAELYDGPFPKPVSWQEGAGLVPQDGFIDELTKTALRDVVAHLDYAERQTFDYFDLRDGQLVMFSSSYLLPEDPELLVELIPGAQAIALIGKVLSEERLTNIETEFSVTNLQIKDEQKNSNVSSLPLIGIFEKPIAWLEWHPPTPGTVVFQKMAPIMAIVSLTFAVLFYSGARLLRTRATRLIAKEAVSFEQARTDALTGIPNRFALFEHFESITKNGTLNCALLIMDLDAFKQVNDTVGHIGGDLYLKALASRLVKLSDDETFVARLGGDEFVIVISSKMSLEQTIKRKVSDLEEISHEQISCKGFIFEVMAAKGAAMLPACEFCYNELLRRADIALYAAKERGSQRVIIYDSLMECEDCERRMIESRLRLAIVDGEGFSIAYQPIVAAEEVREPRRCEALARWYCADLGQVPPDKFIYVAETSGLIIRLGWLLLDMICRDIKAVKNCKFGVNISPVQLMLPDFANLFAERVKMNGVKPEQIEIEITEQIVVRDDMKIFHELAILRDHGFTLALDDFGTGYASIGYLTRMPFDVVKIDRSFAELPKDNPRLQRMVRSMMGLAHAMDLRIIAEGIETPEQALRFRALGADFLQGYYFGRPAQMADYPNVSEPVAAT